MVWAYTEPTFASVSTDVSMACRFPWRILRSWSNVPRAGHGEAILLRSPLPGGNYHMASILCQSCSANACSLLLLRPAQ